MRGRGRRWRERRAAAAIVYVIQQAVLEIRTLAYLREGLRDDLFDGVDYQEQIRLIADVCDTLVPGAARKSGHPALAALEYTWSVAEEGQREWLRAAVAESGVAIDDLIGGDGLAPSGSGSSSGHP